MDPSSIKAGYDVCANKGLIISPHKLGHDARAICDQQGKRNSEIHKSRALHQKMPLITHWAWATHLANMPGPRQPQMAAHMIRQVVGTHAQPQKSCAIENC